MFEHLSVASVPLAFVHILGPLSSFALSLAGVSIGLRCGAVAIAALMAASICADWPKEHGEVARQIWLAILAAAIVAWYHLRRLDSRLE